MQLIDSGREAFNGVIDVENVFRTLLSIPSSMNELKNLRGRIYGYYGIVALSESV